jgi:hypothetical protein
MFLTFLFLICSLQHPQAMAFFCVKFHLQQKLFEKKWPQIIIVGFILTIF